MSAPILATKLYTPPPRANAVQRHRLVERLNAGTQSRLTLVSAPAGFGKTTLVSDWLTQAGRPVAWLSLDEADASLPRFLLYLVTALQQISPAIGKGVMAAFQAPQPPPLEVILTTLVNDLHDHKEPFALVLDDYHRVESSAVDEALLFLLDHAPAHCHVLIATREDPALPLARWRARGELTELRAADLRFNQTEAAGFLNQSMGLSLPAEAIAELDARTEGWAVGLHLAALFLQREPEHTANVSAFTGRHHFVLDYLLEEVLNDQPDELQQFLMQTAALDRFCASLCDTVMDVEPGTSRQRLDRLERANLFLIPLDTERYWYRYHHLFADLLRKRLQQSDPDQAVVQQGLRERHRRASHWFEQQGWHLEAFEQALAAGDVELAARQVEGETLPLHLRGEVRPVLNWLSSLAVSEKQARPGLWIMQASALMMTGELEQIEPCLVSAEQVLQKGDLTDYQRDLLGHAHSIRAFLAVSHQQLDTICHHSRKALELLHPDNLAVRTAANWTLGYAHQLSGERTRAQSAYTEALSISEAIGHEVIRFLSALGLASLKAAGNDLSGAAEAYHQLLLQATDPPWPIYCEVHLNLARVYYGWNQLDSALAHVRQAKVLAGQFAHLDRTLACDILMAQLLAARGKIRDAIVLLKRVREVALQNAFLRILPELIGELSRLLILNGEVKAAAEVIQGHELPLAAARLALARQDATAAMALLEPAYQQALARQWPDEHLTLRIQQALAFQGNGQPHEASECLGDALALAEPGHHLRLFLDEGLPMARLLARVPLSSSHADYLTRLLDAFGPIPPANGQEGRSPLVEPLSPRERAVLVLIAEGLSNQSISERLFLALSTVKGHNRRIFEKLGVQRRTEAVARAQALGLLP